MLLDVLVTHTLWATEIAARLEISIRSIYGSNVETRIGPDDVLFDARAVGRCIKLLFVHKSHRGIDETHTGGLQCTLIELEQELNLVINRDFKRIFFKGTLPV